MITQDSKRSERIENLLTRRSELDKKRSRLSIVGVPVGDQWAVVKADYPFPGTIPSQKNGVVHNPLNWAEDYASLLQQSPAEIYPYERIVGEFHWYLSDLRKAQYPEYIDELRKKAFEAGSNGGCLMHTCPDLSIGLSLGWGGILKKIQESRKKFEQNNMRKEVEYLAACEVVCKSTMKYIHKYAEKAQVLMNTGEDGYARDDPFEIHSTCANISSNPPLSFREAVQWIWFYIIVERINGEGNGYGRLDQLLLPFYEKDLEKGIITRDQARELIAELFIKYPTYYSLGGRRSRMTDATNEASWLCLEAYDMVGGTNSFGVLWHPEINKDFFRYACDILTRHGTGSPGLLNHDVMINSLLPFGFKEEDARNVSYSGCFWYCVPGKEYSCHDMASVKVIKCLMNALEIAFEKKVKTFEQLWGLYTEEIERAIRALRDLTDAQYELQPLIWPEIVPSLVMHGCIEKARDVTDGGVEYNMKTVQMIGFANIVDSLVAIKKCIFDEKRFTLQELKSALENNYEGYKTIRQLLLHAPKFGNDDDVADSMAKKVVENFSDTLKRYKSRLGFGYRPAIFSWIGHVYAGKEIGATPDGRCAGITLAQGANPMHGRNRRGITCTARSLSKLGFSHLAGGVFQLEIDPSFLGNQNASDVLESIARAYFELGGIHIFINVVPIEKLKEAMKHPEEHEDLVVRVTGFSAHFVQLDKAIQMEIIDRTRYR